MKKVFVALFAFVLLGLVASVFLTKMHYKVDRQGMDEKSFCNMSEFVDCDTAVASRYSHLHTPIMTIPTSELGIVYYLLVLLGLLYASGSPYRNATLSFLFGAAFFAVLYSAYQAYVSIVDLGVLCLFCLSTYVANLGILLLLPVAMGIRTAEAPAYLLDYFGSALGLSRKVASPRLTFHLGLTVGLLTLGLLFFRGLNPQVHKPKVRVPRELYLKAYAGIPRKAIDVSDRPYWGNKDAKVVVVEFSDFQCPFCRRAAFTLKPYLKEFRNDVKVVFMNYPLDSSCNPAIQAAMHPVSCMAAKAAACAWKQGKFWELHDGAFENQRRLSRSTLFEIAKDIGLDTASFERCLVSQEAEDFVKKDIEEGNALEIHGTPSLYVNGRFFRDWLDPEKLRLVIEAEKAGSVGQ